jgi:hypothetical protein
MDGGAGGWGGSKGSKRVLTFSSIFLLFIFIERLQKRNLESMLSAGSGCLFVHKKIHQLEKM